jgi:ribosomal protein S17E
MLQEDETLRPLYATAIQRSSNDVKLFRAKLYRLLERYSRNLKEEARTNLELLTARLVSFKSKHLATAIAENYGKKPTALPRGTQITQGANHHANGEADAEDEEEDDFDTEADNSNYEGINEDFEQVKYFLLGSKAFQTLRLQLDAYVDRNDYTVSHLNQVLLLPRSPSA